MEREETTPANHYACVNEKWFLWRSFAVRSAGFPITLTEPLTAPQLDGVVEALFTAETAHEAAVLNAKSMCFDALHAGTEKDPRPLRRALQRLRKGRAPKVSDVAPQFAAAFEDVAKATEAVRQSRLALEESWAIAYTECRAYLRDTAANPRFREAVAWQNWTALCKGLNTFLNQDPEAENKATRRRRALVTRYLQRYCIKNETIGFFGPLCMGQFDASTETLASRPGQSLLSSRSIHLEYWAVDTLADALAQDPQCRPHLRPRLSPLARIEGNRLLGPYGNSSDLTAAQKRFLKACDGRTEAGAIARSLAADPKSGFPTARLVYKQLEQLAQSKILIWRPDVPYGADPEDGLRACLERIRDRKARRYCLDKLDTLTQGKRNLTTAAGDPEAVRQAMQDLEHRFEQATGQSGRRHAGREYAGRTVAYEDCRRDLSLTLGPAFLDALRPPLTLVLESARWFTWKFAEQYRAFLDAVFDDARNRLRRDVMDLDMFWSVLQRQNDTVTMIAEDVADQVAEKWAAILAPGEEPLQFEAAALEDAVHGAFASPTPPLWEAGHHSPDIMIAATEADAIARGEYQIVLGEIHAGGNTLLQSALLNLHPEPETLLRAQARDMPAPVLRPVINRGKPGLRLAYDPLTENDLHIEYDENVSPRPPRQTLKAGMMVVERQDGRLIIRTRDGRRRFPALAFFGSQMRGECARRFRLLPPRPHTPRIAIDRLVLQRENWRAPLAELSFASEKSPLQRYLGARRWAHRTGLPRWVFYRVPGEIKPVFLDMQSPDLVEILAKFIRDNAKDEDAQLSVTEMLPTPEQAWLTDAEGNRYTSEFRIVAVDRSHAAASDELRA